MNEQDDPLAMLSLFRESKDRIESHWAEFVFKYRFWYRHYFQGTPAPSFQKGGTDACNSTNIISEILNLKSQPQRKTKQNKKASM